MADTPDVKQIDKRTLSRYLNKGQLDEKAVERYLKGLPDLAEKAAPVETVMEDDEPTDAGTPLGEDDDEVTQG